MGSYQYAVITNRGQEYIAQALAGEITLTFSHMAISDYAYPAGTNLAALTSLQSVKMTVIPASVWVQGNTVGVRGLFSNLTVSAEYPINTVGVYATDGTTEILFSVSTATTADIMEPYNGVAPSSFIFTVQETINEAESISITVSEAGMATAQDIADLQAQKQDVVTGAASTVTEANLTANRAVISNGSGKLAVSPVTSTELGYLDGVTSNVQTQLNGKQATISGGASTIATSNLTANRALVSNGTGKVVASDVTATELGYLDGVNGNVQTQLDSRVCTSLEGSRFTTFADFIEATAGRTTGRRNWAFNFRDDGGWCPNGTTGTWYRCIVQYQNLIGSEVALQGNLRIYGGSPLFQWHGLISATHEGTTESASEATISWVRTLTSGDGNSGLTPGRALYSGSNGDVVTSDVTSAELNYLDGVTSPIQTQLNGKQATITGAASTVTKTNLAASVVLVSDANGKISASDITATELGYLDGVTANVQSQIDRRTITVQHNYTLKDNFSLPTGQQTGVGGITLTRGRWLLILTARFDANNNGYRQLWLSATENGGVLGVFDMASYGAAPNQQTQIHITIPLSVSSNTTYYAVVKQTSGAALNVSVRYSLVRLFDQS